jgi:hypothetical protein
MHITGMKKRLTSLALTLIMCLGLLMATEITALATPLDSDFELWVGGTPVTAANADDIPAASPAVQTGKAVYNAGTNTLTLTDYRCGNFSDDGGLQGVIHYAGTGTLIVELAGKNTVTAGGGNVTCGIFSNGPLVITGTGSLTATGADGAFEKSCGIRAARLLTVSSGTVNAAGGNTETFTGNNAVSCGLYCDSGDVQIEDGAVNAQGGKTNGQAGSLSAGITGNRISILGGTVRASGAEGSASCGLRVMTYEEYQASPYLREGLIEQEQIVKAYQEIEKAQREAVAASSMVLTSGNYHNASCARGLIQEMIKYKLLQDGMVNSENLRNIKMEWVGNDYESKYLRVQYLDTNKEYHEEYYSYATCDIEGNSLFRWAVSSVIVNGKTVSGEDYAPNVCGINVLRKNVEFTDVPLLKDAGTSRERPFNYELYYTENGVRSLYEGARYEVVMLPDSQGHYLGYDYYTIYDYERDLEARDYVLANLKYDNYGVIIGENAAGVNAVSAGTSAVCGEIKNAIAGSAWTSADADPAEIGASDNPRAPAAPYQRILFGSFPELTADDIDDQTYTGSALTPDITVRDSKDATKQLTPGTDYTVEYTNNVNATTGTQKAKVTVTGFGIYGACSLEKEFAIDPAPVTLTANSGTETYDGTEKTVEGFSCTAGGNTITGLSFPGVSASGSGTDAKEYDVVIYGVTVGQTGDSTGNYVVSEVNSGKLTINPATEPTPAAAFTAAGPDAGTLSGLTDGAQYTVSGAAAADFTLAGGTVYDLTGVSAGTLSVVKKGDGTNTLDSAAQTITVTKAAAPDSVTAADCTTFSNNNGTLTGVTAAMEYRKSDADAWTAGTGGDVTGLVPGTYLVRAAAAGTALASDALEITVAAYAAPPADEELTSAPATELKSGASITPAELDRLIREGETLTVETEDGTKVELSVEALKDIAGQTSGSIKIELTKETPADGTDETGAGTSYDLTVSADGKTIDFSGKVTLKPANTDETPLRTASIKNSDGSRHLVVSGEPFPYTDVTSGSYYYDAVNWADLLGITEGVGDGKFDPAGSCTRAQMVTFLWRAAGKPEPKTVDCPFTDVDPQAYYYKALLWAYENGIVQGIGGGRFAPDGYCDRAQAVTFLFRALGGRADGSIPFGDVAEGQYYSDAVKWAWENGVTEGTTPSTFSPDDDCLRCQIVTFLYRAYSEE